MKTYIQDLVGDENPVDIDCAILQCLIQDAILERLVGPITGKVVIDKAHDVVWDFLSKHQRAARVSIDWTLSRGDEDEGKTIRWISEQ